MKVNNVNANYKSNPSFGIILKGGRNLGRLSGKYCEATVEAKRILKTIGSDKDVVSLEKLTHSAHDYEHEDRVLVKSGKVVSEGRFYQAYAREVDQIADIIVKSAVEVVEKSKKLILEKKEKLGNYFL